MFGITRTIEIDVQETDISAEEGGKVVAFLGPRASYTHQAALDTFPDNDSSYTLSPHTTIEDVFAAVQSGTAWRGVVPFENSSNGSVVYTLDLFADRAGQYPGIVVSGEAYVEVKHCLLGHTASPSSSPPTAAAGLENLAEPDLSHVKKIYSHPQAWGQCTRFLASRLRGVERIDTSSTSRAAELVAGDASGEAVAISSRAAAGEFGLSVLREGVEDRGDNVTRFFVIAKVDEGEAGKEGEERKEDVGFKTLISFTIDHKSPGALAASLNVFAKYGLNLTSISTRPSGVENWNYLFFVEIVGRREEGDEGDVNMALRDLEEVCRGCRWLGSWENRLAG
ncbi:PDT-domain-containing protein [Massarina eburnea CBS 473.64]|uniref:prephenate dehydratase n=1 Tax=Massarina eburnea CBS 473.64 TaxID=1395130 RepID=A0A6A6RRU7_9PLEO|nr:PDT-domain-containing protein [Massarina eburnea CBS 473.64]